jgi:hypothetical protein
MKKTLFGLAVLALVALAAPSPAAARASVFLGVPGFGFFGGPPVVVPPPVVYAPPVYYGGPYYYGRPYYGRPYYGRSYPVYGPYWGRGWHRGWYKHGRW